MTDEQKKPVSMEPVAWELFFYNGESQGFTKNKGEAAEFGEDVIELYTATQLAQARQQGAQEERKKLEEIQIRCNNLSLKSAQQRIAELERTNAVLLEALQLIAQGHHDPQPTRSLYNLESDAMKVDAWWSDYYTSNDQQNKRIARAAIAAAEGVKA